VSERESPSPVLSPRINSAGNANVALLRVANWLRLAATPTFAVMALLVAPDASLPNVVCGARDASLLSGMVVMYLLMSLFHSACWLKLIPHYWPSRKPT
jgi:hypothetical protein